MWHVTSLVVSFVALLVALPSWGFMAAAWISLTSYAIAAVGMTASVARAESISLVELMVPRHADFRRAIHLVRGRGPVI